MQHKNIYMHQEIHVKWSVCTVPADKDQQLVSDLDVPFSYCLRHLQRQCLPRVSSRNEWAEHTMTRCCHGEEEVKT